MKGSHLCHGPRNHWQRKTVRSLAAQGGTQTDCNPLAVIGRFAPDLAGYWPHRKEKMDQPSLYLYVFGLFQTWLGRLPDLDRVDTLHLHTSVRLAQ